MSPSQSIALSPRTVIGIYGLPASVLIQLLPYMCRRLGKGAGCDAFRCLSDPLFLPSVCRLSSRKAGMDFLFPKPSLRIF